MFFRELFESGIWLLLFPLTIFMLLTALFVLFIYFIAKMIHSEKQRVKDIQAQAAKSGLTFHNNRDRGMQKFFQRLPIFRMGFFRYVIMRLEGKRGEDAFTIFELKCEQKHGGERHDPTYIFNGAVLRLPQAFPFLLYRELSTLEKLTDIFGPGSKSFDLKGWNKRYRVTSDDLQFAQDFFSSSMFEMFQSMGLPYFAINENYLVIYEYKSLTANRVEEHIETLRTIRENMSRFLGNRTSI